MNRFYFIFALVCIVANPSWANHSNNQGENDRKESPNKGAKESLRKDDGLENGMLNPRGFEYMRTNVISTIYHEMAHAMIDFMGIPIYGQEEDAADVFSVVMVETMFSDLEALKINRGAALGFKFDYRARVANGDEWSWADEHGPHMQRYYNIVCLTYGADPDGRKEFAENMKLPEYRAENCAAEYQVALHAWKPIIEGMSAPTKGQTIRFQHSVRSNLQTQAAELIERQVLAFNKQYQLPQKLRMSVKRCGREASLYAFYAPERKKITICTNYIDELYRNGQK